MHLVGWFECMMMHGLTKPKNTEYFYALNGTHELLAYADDINILGGSVHTVKENAEALVVATKEMD